MSVRKKKFLKPFYKQFVLLRENAQNRRNFIKKFKKKKWEKLIFYLKKKLYKRKKLVDQGKFKLSKFASLGNSMKKTFRNSLRAGKRFNLFYGGLSKRYLKIKIKLILKKKPKLFDNSYIYLIKFFESRLETVLYRAQFTLSIRNARQLIYHGHILVNSKTVTSKSYLLKEGDIISIKPKSKKLIENNLRKSFFWPIPARHLMINYNTLEILITSMSNEEFLECFPYFLDINYVIEHYTRH